MMVRIGGGTYRGRGRARSLVGGRAPILDACEQAARAHAGESRDFDRRKDDANTGRNMKPLAEFVWMTEGRGVVGRPRARDVARAALRQLGVRSVRVYDTPRGPCAFRLTDHIRRLFDSARMYGIALPFSESDIVEGCKSVVQRNGLKNAYIRPIAFLGECGHERYAE